MGWLLGALVLLPAAAAGQTLVVDYDFARPTIAPVDVAGQSYDRVSLPGAPSGGNAGEPALPARGAHVLLPYGTGPDQVRIVAGERILLGRGLRIEPVARPVPLSHPELAAPPQPNPAIYASDQPFPAERGLTVALQQFRGYSFLVLKLNPVEYLPATGELYYYPRLSVEVDAVPAPVSPLFRGLAQDRAELAGKVDNPAAARTYPAVQRAGRSVGMVIITTAALAPTFQPLADDHTSHGLLTEVVDAATIGGNNPDNLRSYIRGRYLADGLEYVLIGGDDDVMPAKDLYVSDSGYTEPDMPGDLYFGCLDGTWNYDNDANWGEINDGEGGGPLDLVHDVYVGRACAGNTTEAARFVAKTLWYLGNSHAHPEKILLVGEHLGFGGVAEYATAYMEELVDGSSAHGYTTVGFPSELLAIDRLYDSAGYTWPASLLISKINNSVLVVNHLGHGAPDYAMKLYNPDVLTLVNNDLCFVYSQTCDAGWFDGTDCWAETANIKTDHGAFGVVMNARYGFGEFNSTDGPSQRYNREFWDAVYNPDESKTEMGRANADSKEDNLYRIGQEYMRWCYYEINLFGDPAAPLPGACRDAGTVELDRGKYACEDALGLQVADCGLNLNPDVLDVATVTVASASEPAGEVVTLVETQTNSSRFAGTLPVSGTNAPGVLRVAAGDALTATYIDADDGAGHYNVAVTDTAVIDCSAPSISAVQAINIEPRSATVTCTANEPVRLTVHYGLSCESLNQTAYGSAFATTPVAELTGLQDDHTYYYRVDATDEAGNTVSDPECYWFTTPEVPDFFTEQFTNNDLDNLSLSFTPNGSVDYYLGCVEPITALPTNPTGGTALSLTDDSYATVNLGGGATVTLYGVSYTRFYVGSNGYITFNSGDSTNTESLANHFNQPRISALFDDLNPGSGSITWKQLADHVAVTWLNVPKWNTSQMNTFQIEIFYDGQVTLNYLAIGITDGLAGLSEGEGVNPDFLMDDFSLLGPCEPTPPEAHPGSATTPLATPVTVVLDGDDDGLPDPPGMLSFIITALPGHGTLTDPQGEAITAVPYTLLAGGNAVVYTPGAIFVGTDTFQFKANDGGEPPQGGDSPLASFSITVFVEPEQVYFFPLDTNPGWTTEGAWAFGQPTGGGSHARDPNCGCTGMCVYGYNLAGDYTNNLPARNLTTTPIDCSGMGGVTLKFKRRLGVEASDVAAIKVSADGANWTTVWSNNATSCNEATWSAVSYDLSAVADHQPAVQVRWVMGPTDSSVTYPGWNIDDVEIWAMVPPQAETGDMNCDGVIGFGDINPFVLALTSPSGYALQYPDCDLNLGDVNGNGTFGFDDINPFVVLLSNP